MIRLFQRLAQRHPTSNETGAEQADAFLRTPPAPMPEIRPPTAVNDDPLRPAHAEVERELRVAGFLR